MRHSDHAVSPTVSMRTSSARKSGTAAKTADQFARTCSRPRKARSEWRAARCRSPRRSTRQTRRRRGRSSPRAGAPPLVRPSCSRRTACPGSLPTRVPVALTGQRVAVGSARERSPSTTPATWSRATSRLHVPTAVKLAAGRTRGGGAPAQTATRRAIPASASAGHRLLCARRVRVRLGRLEELTDLLTQLRRVLMLVH
jgi:hypothetical protein